jgi:hypothetical protein
MKPPHPLWNTLAMAEKLAWPSAGSAAFFLLFSPFLNAVKMAEFRLLIKNSL